MLKILIINYANNFFKIVHLNIIYLKNLGSDNNFKLN